MPKVKLQAMSMKGVVACVPEHEVSNEKDYPWFEPSEIRKVTAMVGVKSRRVVTGKTCASDLCRAAASRLLQQIDWAPESVDGLIVVSQTFDYIMPATSCMIQHQLGISINSACFDVALGCSAYVYGLWLANSLLACGACKRILLLAGDTPSKFVNPKDRATALLFGDAGTATALETGPTDSSTAHYIIYTDGAGARDLIIEGGGFRNRFPEPPEAYCVTMDGGHVFDFTRTRVPALIAEMFELSGMTSENYDWFVFHQANEYLIKFIASKSRIDMHKVPLSIRNFGNTSAASVALTLAVAGLPPGAQESLNVMFLGFGVGLSWGAASMPVNRSLLLDHFIYAD